MNAASMAPTISKGLIKLREAFMRVPPALETITSVGGAVTRFYL
jgi:hypothetical protein